MYAGKQTLFEYYYYFYPMQILESAILKREATENTPFILFDNEKGHLEISGVSVPENGVEFYKALLESLDNYLESPAKLTTVIINLDYFNISSSKMILFIFYKLMEVKTRGNEVIVHWLYTDDDLLEAGTDYEHMTKLNFIYKKFSPDKISEN
jgi:hypothetical protein